MRFLTLSVREQQWVGHGTDVLVVVVHRPPALLAVEDGVDVDASCDCREFVYTGIEED